MIATTLATIDTWYNEPTAGPERPKLLSKLALLELCGWLETEQDRIMTALDSSCLKDPAWTQKEILDKTFGFDYGKHFRPMVVRLIGEHLTRALEQKIENKFPGDLDRLRSSTGDLWTRRCNFAHADIVANIAKQQTFAAPSWSINQYRIISKMLLRFEAEAVIITGAL
jgi:hypothetical protein